MTSARRPVPPDQHLAAELRGIAREVGRPVDGRTDAQLLDGMRLLRRAIADAAAVQLPALGAVR